MKTTFEFRGHTFQLEVYPDECSGAPWDMDDSTGLVSYWTRRDKRSGEWVLSTDHGSKRYYDFAETMKKAKREGWDTPPYRVGTKGERAVRAVTADFERLRRWCDDGWCYATLHVTLLDPSGYETEYDDHLGGVEYDYSTESVLIDAQEMADGVLIRFSYENRFRLALECGV